MGRKNVAVLVFACLVLYLLSIASSCNGVAALYDIGTHYVTTTTVSIAWRTDDPGTSQIEYGTDTSYGQAIPPWYNNTGGGNGTMLRGLRPGTTYHYRIRFTDYSGRKAVSEDYTFTTLAEE